METLYVAFWSRRDTVNLYLRHPAAGRFCCIIGIHESRDHEIVRGERLLPLLFKGLPDLFAGQGHRQDRPGKRLDSIQVAPGNISLGTGLPGMSPEVSESHICFHRSPLAVRHHISQCRFPGTASWSRVIFRAATPITWFYHRAQ